MDDGAQSSASLLSPGVLIFPRLLKAKANCLPEELSALPFESLYGLATGSEGFFDWDIGDVELGDMGPLDMSPLNWLHSTAIETATSTTQGIHPAQAITLPPSSELIRDAQPPDTPWVGLALDPTVFCASN